MKQLVLVHTGITEYDKQGRIQGTLDVPLSKVGRDQIEAITQELAPLGATNLFTSPGQASVQTSEILSAALSLKVRPLDKLTNINYGLWQGMLVEDVKLKQPKVFRKWQEQPATVCPPEGETIPKITDRVAEVMTKITKKVKPDSTTLLVAPAPLASIVRHVVTGADLGNLWQSFEAAGSWEIFPLDKPVKVEIGGP
ncbi:histidine phosphatase family protein [Aeoliella mucimassa]|uniref:Phosphoserine phosphatase 1 n=1 Tax=Aeoliella mucimassa TaxID=2527972 RepID=A0A518AH67_9BACT|nr:histidine phosphatase family protein [Aeoliella mucimassa]QDU54068.1 Phosphoserine phosphatase 1 [Aeoliella mucimassa]